MLWPRWRLPCGSRSWCVSTGTASMPPEWWRCHLSRSVRGIKYYCCQQLMLDWQTALGWNNIDICTGIIGQVQRHQVGWNGPVIAGRYRSDSTAALFLKMFYCTEKVQLNYLRVILIHACSNPIDSITWRKSSTTLTEVWRCLHRISEVRVVGSYMAITIWSGSRAMVLSSWTKLGLRFLVAGPNRLPIKPMWQQSSLLQLQSIPFLANGKNELSWM